MGSKHSRKARRQRAIHRKKRKHWANLAVLATVIGIAAAVLLWPRTPPVEVAPERLDDNPSIGDPGAPVTVTEFGDFTCSACRSWHQAGVLLQIVEKYAGQVRLEWRDLPIITPDSPKAAEAGQCAHDQGRFWEYLDRVYREPGSSYTNARAADLPRYAADIGLDVHDFQACLEDGRHRSTVSFDLDFARSLGLNGTPSFLVNGTPIVGGNPELIVQAIESALADSN